MAKILVLDDVLDATILIKKILERKGHEVAAFTEEEEAIDHVRGNEVDLAILDINLKKTSGVEVLEEMKHISPKIKAIMLTGYPTIASVRQSVVLGVREFFIKPVEKEILEAKVELVVNR
jgi:DNA-binding NtrC family response regulator